MNVQYSMQHFMLRKRYQVLFGLIASVLLPVILRSVFAWDTILILSSQVTMAAAVVAHTCGFLIYKRLESFPGNSGFSTILPAFVLSYGVVFVSIFFLRLDYSRMQAAGSFLISAFWYFGFHVFTTRKYNYHLAIIPYGDVDQINTIKSVIWTRLKRPEKQLFKVHGLVADLRADLPDTWERFITDSVLSGTPVYHVKQVLESLTGRVSIEHLSENTFGSLTPNQLYLMVKRIVDRLMALILLVLTSPLLIVLAIAIRLDSPGPALFRQSRMGYRGVPFTVYKFRTMRTDTDKATSAREKAITIEGDPRITSLGRFLRKSRLDELPQALNVLRGEMSWIGPRPEAEVLSRWYEEELPFYRYRHIVLPGVTGWAQVTQGHVASVDEVNEKLYYDFYYIKNFSLWLDIVIVLRTIRIMLTGFGAR